MDGYSRDNNYLTKAMILNVLSRSPSYNTNLQQTIWKQVFSSVLIPKSPKYLWIELHMNIWTKTTVKEWQSGGND